MNSKRYKRCGQGAGGTGLHAWMGQPPAQASRHAEAGGDSAPQLATDYPSAPQPCLRDVAQGLAERDVGWQIVDVDLWLRVVWPPPCSPASNALASRCNDTDPPMQRRQQRPAARGGQAVPRFTQELSCALAGAKGCTAWPTHGSCLMSHWSASLESGIVCNASGSLKGSCWPCAACTLCVQVCGP